MPHCFTSVGIILFQHRLIYIADALVTSIAIEQVDHVRAYYTAARAPHRQARQYEFLRYQAATYGTVDAYIRSLIMHHIECVTVIISDNLLFSPVATAFMPPGEIMFFGCYTLLARYRIRYNNAISSLICASSNAAPTAISGNRLQRLSRLYQR